MERPFLHFEGRILSWQDFDRRSDEIAAGLARIGVSKGDAVGILMKNRPEFVETMFGIFKAGASVVLLNIRHTPAEMLHPVIDSGLRTIIADAAKLPALQEASRAVPDLKIFAIDAPEGIPSLDLLRESGGAAPDVDLSPDDIAFICYTSGTTGAPKGALLSHGAIHTASVAKSLALAQSFEDRMLLAQPLAYTGGAVILIREVIVPGATVFLMENADPGEMLATIERERITATGGVAVVFERMMAHPRFATTDLSSITRVTTGGQMVSLHLLRTWRARGVLLNQGYGQTETAGSFCTILFAEEAERKLGFAGRPLPHCRIKIVDDIGGELPPNQIGEILVKSPATMKGYLNLPDQTAAAFTEGWLHTGDLGFLDEEGFLKVVDRSKDVLISGGLNVYPAEIEKELGGIGGLEDFAVIGVPDDRWGEVPAIVMAGATTIDLIALRATCESRLADYKRPKFLVRHGATLPRTASGKVMKHELRSAYARAPRDAILLKG
jgi:fatty-acyl-CoA synthase